jgi:hypothetical protein
VSISADRDERSADVGSMAWCCWLVTFGLAFAAPDAAPAKAKAVRAAQRVKAPVPPKRPRFLIIDYTPLSG